MKKLFTLFAVATMAFAAQAATLTVADGTTTNGHFPMYGLYCDTEGTLSQMIYPADMLTDMVGKQITEIKFYANAEISENLEGCLMNFALKIVEENEFPTSAVFEIAEGDICGTVSPVVGATEFVLTLNQPFLYEGGNLLIGTEVIETSGWKGTYFYGIETGLYGGCYQYTTSYASTLCYREAFLPKATFTYETGEEPPVEPTEKTQSPSISATAGNQCYTVVVENNPADPDATIYISFDGENFEVYTEPIVLTEYGTYTIWAYAVADGKLPSNNAFVGFTIDENTQPDLTAVSELNGQKAVAGVRYFNMAGQEMPQAEGLTIVVTTYTDGTTSAVKVVK